MAKRRAPQSLFLACWAFLIFAQPATWAQTVTSTNVTDIPNIPAGNEPFAGGVRVTHEINTGNAAGVRDFHVCVASTKTDPTKGTHEMTGDSRNHNYREAPNGTPNGWAYRGVQSGTPVVRANVTKRVWCVTWVKTTDGGAADNSRLTFEHDYRGDKNLKKKKKQAKFTSDGDNNWNTGLVGTGSGVSVAARFDTIPGGLAGAIVFALLVVGILGLLLYVVLRRNLKTSVEGSG